jgi:hypothetical protein
MSLFNLDALANALALVLDRDQPIEVGDRVHYSGFFGSLPGVVTDVTGYADGSVFEFEVYLDNGLTALARPRQVSRMR